MVVLGLLILLLAVIAVVAFVARGGDPASIDLEAFTIRTSVTGVFMAGALTLLVGVLGVMALLAGLRRSRRRRTEMRDLRQQAGSEGGSRRGRSSEVEHGQYAAPSSAKDRPATAPPSGDDDRGRRGGGADDSFDSAPRDR